MTMTVRPRARPWARPLVPRPPARRSRPAGPSADPVARAASASPEYRSTSLPGPPAWCAGRRIGALTLPELDPGRSVAGDPAAAAGVVIVLLGSMVAHELAHSIMARRYGLRFRRPSGSSAGCGTAGRTGQDRPVSWSCRVLALSGGSPRPGP